MSEDRGGERIRKAFERELAPPSDGFASRMAASVVAPPAARRPRRWPFELAAAVLAIVAVAALSLPHLLAQPSTAPTTQPGTGIIEPGVVPWADLPVPNVAQPFTKPGVPACRASELTISLSSIYVGGGPLNVSTWTVAVTSSKETECFVGPGMDIAFSSAQGPLKMTRYVWPGDIVYLANGQRAVGEIDLGPCFDPRVTAMTFTPGQGLGSVTVNPGPPGGTGTPCPQKPETYFVELYADQDRIGYAAFVTSALSQAPSLAHPGERLRFLVTLINHRATHHSIAGSVDPTPSPLTWASCPTYHMELEGVEESFHTYRLNCAAANTIAPNGSETFEMFLDIPRDAKPGPATLVWSIDGSPQQWQRATAFVPIES